MSAPVLGNNRALTFKGNLGYANVTLDSEKLSFLMDGVMRRWP
jgi:hypothetical protein